MGSHVLHFHSTFCHTVLQTLHVLYVFFQYYKAAVSGTFVTILMEWKATEKYVFFILIFFTFQAEIQQFIQNSEALLLLCKYVQKDSRISG